MLRFRVERTYSFWSSTADLMLPDLITARAVSTPSSKLVRARETMMSDAVSIGFFGSVFGAVLAAVVFAVAFLARGFALVVLAFGVASVICSLLYRVATRIYASGSPHIPARRICALHNEVISPCPSVKYFLCVAQIIA